MKRSAEFAQFDSEHVWKEPKEEIEDDPDLYNYANGTFQSSSLADGTECVVKEEVVDEDDPYNQNFLADQMIKEEVPDECFPFERIVKEEYPDMRDTQSPATRKWRPCGLDLQDYLTKQENFDDEYGNFDLGLGNSILFQNPSEKKPSVRSEERSFEDDEAEEYFPYDDDDDEQSGSKSLLPSRIKKLLEQAFAENQHPNAAEMIKIAQTCGIRYRSVYEKFERKRVQLRIKCKKNDACQRIKTFFMREYDALQNAQIAPETRAVLERELEAHLVAKKRFSVGYVHVIMEKTDLSPAYIRGQYESWKRRLLTNNREDYRIEDWKRETVEEQNKLPREILKEMEDAYLKKKYQSQHKDWSPKEIKTLAAEVHLDEKTVADWLQKRSGAASVLSNDAITIAANTEQPKVGAGHAKKLPSRARAALNAEFAINSRPDVETRLRLSEQLGLTDLQIRNYFNKRRILKRRDKEWEDAVQEVSRLPRQKVALLEKFAAEKRKPASEYMKAAEEIGVSYITLTSYVNWKKFTRLVNR